MPVAKKWVMVKMFNGTPRLSDFKCEEETLPPLGPDDFRCRALVWSVDPYIKYFSAPSLDHLPVMSFQLAEWAACLKTTFGHFGWCTECVTNGLDDYCDAYIAPEMLSLPPSAAIGILGMPGITAYLGIMDYCEAKKDDVVVVTAAAGAVGHVACQIAKIIGCTVIAFTGSDEKVSWLKSELDLEYVFNYKTKSINDVLADLNFKQVDCYFDNVGGEQSNAIMNYMNPGSRVCVCGSISENSREGSITRFDYVKAKKRKIITKSISVFSLQHKWPSAIDRLREWVEKGDLKYREHAFHGFDNIPQAFIEQIGGQHYGKLVIYADS